MSHQNKSQKRKNRHIRIRAKVKGTNSRPRLCLFRSNKHIYAELIDDQKGKILVSGSDFELEKNKGKEKKSEKGKIAKANAVGKLIAEKALEKGFKKAVFDRGGFNYHGRVKALAEGAREKGLEF
jgi:large subunit ribosomal protein L18